MSKTRICILGSNSGRNTGDAAILASIINNFLKINPELGFDVPTTNGRYIRERFQGKDVRPVSMMPWTGSLRFLGLPTFFSIMFSKAVFITDGIIFDVKLFNPIFNFLILLVFLVPFAKMLGKKVICFCVGVGPLETGIGRRFARWVCNLCDAVLVREQSSYDLLVGIGVKKELLEIYADVAFINNPASEKRAEEILQEIGALPGKPIIGININTYIDQWLKSAGKISKERFISEFAKAVDSVLDKLDVQIVFTLTQVMDIEIAENIRKRLVKGGRVRVLSNKYYTNHELMAVMGRMELFVGMRLHSIILSSAMYVPVLGLVYAPKVGHFFKMLGMEDSMYLLDNLESNSLSSAIIEAYNQRIETRKWMKPKIELVKQKVEEAFRLVNERYLK